MVKFAQKIVIAQIAKTMKTSLNKETKQSLKHWTKILLVSIKKLMIQNI